MGNLNESVDKVMLYEFYLALALGFLYYSMFWNKFHMGNFSCDCFSFWLHVIWTEWKKVKTKYIIFTYIHFPFNIVL